MPSRSKPKEEEEEEEEEFDVERLLDERRVAGGKQEYLVQWKGYPSDANTWE
jgi:hypothetical protein